MWNRQEVKAKGKESFKKNYWNCVLVAVIYTILFASTTGSGAASKRDELSAEFSAQINESPNPIALAAVIIGVLGIAVIIATLVDVFLVNPIEVGCGRFFLLNQSEQAGVGELGHPFKNNYGNVVVGVFLRDLILAIGFMLFIIPGVILTYSFRMVPYILAEDPTVSAIDALKRSRAMMQGNKWKAFVFDLSFILWYLLAGITCGLLAIFYVNPYKNSADAALYQAIKG